MTYTSLQQSVYIIIPVHNRKETTLNCLENLAKYNYLEQYNVVVVDDDSTDGTGEAIKQLYPDVDILQGDGDLWWTGGIVLGMQYAFEQGADYFIWLNDDCIPNAETFPLLIEFAESHPRTIVAPTCYNNSLGTNNKKNNGFRRRQPCAADPGEVLEVDGIAGWCVCIPAAVFQEIGPPDSQRFPHYGADGMYILKATQSGFKACVFGNAKAILLGPIGSSHPKRSFRNYFHTDRKPQETFQDLFLSKRSPYRLSTQFYYHTAMYGKIGGTFLFAAKSILWFFNWLRLQVLFSFKLSSSVSLAD